ncbi:MAG: hypothetical protein JOZ92_02680 [Candidatus Dormibacteraeota bacterium]|nr:hypothetical protein [Candidatus Dormibacteraeota bacterium]
MHGETEITLDEAYRGTTRTVELNENGMHRRVEVRIPAGIGDGARVRAGGQGGQGVGGAAAGDLLVRVRVLPDGRFRREGSDLHVRVPVPLRTAVAGGTVAVPSLSGRQVELTVPAGSQNGARLRLRGLGMPRLRGEGRGDLFATLDVRIPQPVPEELRRWAEA